MSSHRHQNLRATSGTASGGPSGTLSGFPSGTLSGLPSATLRPIRQVTSALSLALLACQAMASGGPASSSPGSAAPTASTASTISTASTAPAASASAPASAPAPAPAPAPTSCAISAFVEETDPSGLRVREAPNANARILGTLPPVWKGEDGLRVRVSVQVTDTSNGWFRIREAYDNDALTGQPARPLYAGEGWVSGRMLVVKSQAQVGRQRPDVKAPVSVRLKEDASFDGDSAVAAGRLVGCQGAWAQVEFDESRLSADMKPLVQVLPAARAGQRPGRFRAWLNQICGIQETTCDGLADEAAPAR